MRKRFEPQFVLGQKLIQDTPIPKKSRDSLAALVIALKTIYTTAEYNEQVYKILENKILSGKKATGRPGMNLWQIFVLAQVRLCWNLSYDSLCWMANNDRTIRQLMGIETAFGYPEIEISYQNILDNVGLLDDATIKEINDVIVVFGHEVFKKKDAEALRLKTDSFVVESNVHFPTDYNLLWDSARKCLDTVTALLKKHPGTIGWRKLDDWGSEIKGLMRKLGKSTSSGGKDKRIREKVAALSYLQKAKALVNKLESEKLNFPLIDKGDLVLQLNLDKFLELLKKHIDLVNRRLIHEQEIPHHEKMFSIFEEYTEWINKGKQHPSVELGKNVSITTDQYGLIIDYHTMNHETDNQIVLDLGCRILLKYRVASWSFDKGFFCKENKELLQEQVGKLIMPKKGKCNKAEREEETTRIFIKLRKKHSAIESNINELEHRGLDRCPDKGYPHFKRYIGLGVCAYNLRRIGHKLLEELKQAEARQAA